MSDTLVLFFLSTDLKPLFVQCISLFVNKVPTKLLRLFIIEFSKHHHLCLMSDQAVSVTQTLMEQGYLKDIQILWLIIVIDGLSPALIDQAAVSFFQTETYISGPKPAVRASPVPLTCIKPCQNLWFLTVHRVFLHTIHFLPGSINFVPHHYLALLTSSKKIIVISI